MGGAASPPDARRARTRSRLFLSVRRAVVQFGVGLTACGLDAVELLALDPLSRVLTDDLRYIVQHVCKRLRRRDDVIGEKVRMFFEVTADVLADLLPVRVLSVERSIAFQNGALGLCRDESVRLLRA